ncbi:unnamed protein product [Heligmosomoides polygyrus]|uniref:PID domain-containing protein n=1 Tax=Heligmosomoides polygyrus TaxID=6339 RepID=A0A183FAY5_HELPZ|nr:unnamed protein product [Heligmosomoides polygyrus]
MMCYEAVRDPAAGQRWTFPVPWIGAKFSDKNNDGYDRVLFHAVACACHIGQGRRSVTRKEYRLCSVATAVRHFERGFSSGQLMIRITKTGLRGQRRHLQFIADDK